MVDDIAKMKHHAILGNLGNLGDEIDGGGLFAGRRGGQIASRYTLIPPDPSRSPAATSDTPAGPGRHPGTVPAAISQGPAAGQDSGSMTTRLRALRIAAAVEHETIGSYLNLNRLADANRLKPTTLAALLGMSRRWRRDNDDADGWTGQTTDRLGVLTGQPSASLIHALPALNDHCTRHGGADGPHRGAHRLPTVPGPPWNSWPGHPPSPRARMCLPPSPMLAGRRPPAPIGRSARHPARQRASPPAGPPSRPRRPARLPAGPHRAHQLVPNRVSPSTTTLDLATGSAPRRPLPRPTPPKPGPHRTRLLPRNRHPHQDVHLTPLAHPPGPARRGATSSGPRARG